MSELVTKSVAQEQQEQTRTEDRDTHRRGTHHRLYHRCESRGSARRPRRHGRFRTGQVLAEIAERNRVLRLQGIRGLVGGLFRADRRNTQGHRRQSEDDQVVQGRRSGQRPAFPGGFHDREASVEAEEEHGGPFRRGGARRLFPGFRHGKGQQEISEKRRVGIRGVQLRSRIGQVHGRSQKPLRLRIRVPYASEGKGLHLPPVPEALNRACPDIQVPGAAVGGCSAFAVCRCCVTCLVRIQLRLADFLHSVRVASVRAGCRQAIDVYGYCSRELLQAV
jgi:hypothetical protein